MDLNVLSNNLVIFFQILHHNCDVNKTLLPTSLLLVYSEAEKED